jgi:hypothetical protein
MGAVIDPFEDWLENELAPGLCIGGDELVRR